MGNPKCLLFDKSNMVKLGQNGKVSDLNMTNDQMHLMYFQKNQIFLLTLLYHDISSNTIKPIQHLVVNASSITYKQLSEYLQNGFIAKNEKQRLFQMQFQKQRKDLNVNQIFFYNHDRIGSKYETAYLFWHKARLYEYKFGVTMYSRWCAIIFSLGDIEIADYPQAGQLCAYTSGKYCILVSASTESKDISKLIDTKFNWGHSNKNKKIFFVQIDM